MDKKRTLHVRVPEEVYEAVDKKADELEEDSYGDVTKSDVLRLALTEHLDDNSDKSS